MAFEKMAARFGAGLFDRVGKFWEGISAPLISAFDGTFIAFVLQFTADSRSECRGDRRVPIGKYLFWTGCDRRPHFVTTHRPFARPLTSPTRDHPVPIHCPCFAVQVLVNQDYRGQVPSCSMRRHDGRRDEADGR
jgi:hypothetical protein